MVSPESFLETGISWFGLLVGILIGVVGTLAASYLSWMGEVRRQGFQSLREMYDAAHKAVTATSLFVANAGGFAKIDWEKVQRGETDHIYEWHGKTVRRIFEFQASVEKCSLYLSDSDRRKVKEILKGLWDFFLESGRDLARDRKRNDEFYDAVEQIRGLVVTNFLSGRGFLKHIFSGIFK